MRKVFMYMFALLAFVACKDDSSVDPTEQPSLSISKATLSFETEGGKETLNITSNTLWNISYPASLWCRPSMKAATGDADVTIFVDANDVEEDRTATFVLSAEGVEDITISIAQKAKPAGPEEPTEPVYEETIAPDNTGMRNLSAIEFSKLMKVGWNLGNSLEAIIRDETTRVLSGNETSWGNPIVTKVLIDAVKAAGFNAIRIPVSWSHQFEAGADYKIKWAWKKRVEEVVKYVLDNDMYVIINIHWDGGWLDQPDYAHQEQINTRMAAMWKQIAIYFRNYDDHLLFAGTNEVHIEDNYNAPSAENVDVQNSFNQTFVNTVRATGGKNTYRHLIVQAYNTNIDHAVKYLKMPTDNTPDRLMTEVHFYDPYDFALQTASGYKTQWGKDYVGGDVSSWGQEAWVDEVFGKMKTEFVDKGIPVILGEYGAILRSSLTGNSLDKHVAARNYYLKYVTKSAVEKGLIPFYWDNGHTGDLGFGLFNRSTATVVHSASLNAIMTGVESGLESQ